MPDYVAADGSKCALCANPEYSSMSLQFQLTGFKALMCIIGGDTFISWNARIQFPPETGTQRSFLGRNDVFCVQ